MKFISAAVILFACTQTAVLARGGDGDRFHGFDPAQCGNGGVTTVTVTAGGGGGGAVVTKTVTVNNPGATAGTGNDNNNDNTGTGVNNGADNGGDVNNGADTGVDNGNTGADNGNTGVDNGNTGADNGNTGADNGNAGKGNDGTGNAGTGNAGNGNAGKGNGGDAQSSLTLDPSLIGANLAKDGLDAAEAGQVASLTSTNNFINFCLGQTITNGQQVKEGSCNPVVMGQIPSKDAMPSCKFVSPKNFDTIAPNTAFTVSMAIQGMETGNFVNPNANYFAAPQQLKGNQITGHSHIVIQLIDSISSTAVADPKVFAFFKGLNAAAQGGILSASVDKGLPNGVYRISSINTASNHQPVLVPVAQHGSLDDAVYITVSDNGNAAGNATADPAAADPAAADAKAADAKAADAKAADAKAADAKAADAKTADAKAATDAKAADAKTADAKTADAKTADAKTADAKAADAKATDAKATTNTAVAKTATSDKASTAKQAGKRRRFHLSRTA